MDIALIGYGKMGRLIEQLAETRNHHVVLKISSSNQGAFNESNLQMADVAIEFSQPDAAFENVRRCLKAGLPVVSGTTGWGGQLDKIREKCLELNGSFLWASNFSIGVNLFFELNRQLAVLMDDYPEYRVSVDETHHLEKKDKPSGTAITLAEELLNNLSGKKRWHSGEFADGADIIPVASHREAGVTGTHTVKYCSDIDDLEITHRAHSRNGFAFGALLAAEFIRNKKGVFTMRDVLHRHEDY